MEKETRKCKVCGRELPLTEYNPTGIHGGRRHVCKGCMKSYHAKWRAQKKDKRDELRSATRKMLDNLDRETIYEYLMSLPPKLLIQALHDKGYKGKLTYTEVKTINVEDVDMDIDSILDGDDDEPSILDMMID